MSKYLFLFFILLAAQVRKLVHETYTYFENLALAEDFPWLCNLEVQDVFFRRYRGG